MYIGSQKPQHSCSRYNTITGTTERRIQTFSGNWMKLQGTNFLFDFGARLLMLCSCCIHYLIVVCRAFLNLNLTQGRPCLPTKEWNAMLPCYHVLQSRERCLHFDTGTEGYRRHNCFIALSTNCVDCNHGTRFTLDHFKQLGIGSQLPPNTRTHTH